MNKIEKIKAKDRSYKQWFKFLPAELRQKAITNAKNDPEPVDLGTKVIPFSLAISGCFSWKYTPEGHDFWREIDEAWRNGNFLPQDPMFKVGDRVYSKAMGLGVVVPNEDRRPIGHVSVDYGESGTMVFGKDGLMLSRPGNHEDYHIYRLTPMQKFAIGRLILAGELGIVELAESWAIENGIELTSRNEIGYTLAATRCLKSLQSLGLVNAEDLGGDFICYKLATA